MTYTLTVKDLILNYLYGVYEKNVDIQCRFKWTPGASGMSFVVFKIAH